METLDYLAANSGSEGISDVQKQMASDMSGRKPLLMGKSDTSALAEGNLSRTLDQSLDSRLNAGKISGTDLSRASSDELDRIATHVSQNGANLDPASKAALKQQILEFRTDPRLAAQQPAKEITDRMDTIYNGL